IYEHPVQTLLYETASEQPFKSMLNGWARKPDILPLEEYGELLYKHLGGNIHIFSKVYPHLLEDIDELIEWVRGTSLIPYLERLPLSIHDLFVDRYRQKLHMHLEGNEGEIKYFFNRFFLIGKKEL
ncbi:MAG: hypothetical protein AAFY76_21915, partial [Cyanobacteria bacterium J06649_11]